MGAGPCARAAPCSRSNPRTFPTRGDAAMTFTHRPRQTFATAPIAFLLQGSPPPRPGKPRRPSRQGRSRSFGPSLEVLEDRTLLSGTPGALDSSLLTPVPDGTPIAMHIHPHLSILVNGQDQVIPADIGVEAGGD